jgi:ABC-type uncharacterized transport system fused permease/ATPase subunit
LIYPQTEENYFKTGCSDDHLLELLSQMKLAYILEREGGWDVVKEWTDVLSGGEKQRMAIGRLCY